MCGNPLLASFERMRHTRNDNGRALPHVVLEPGSDVLCRSIPKLIFFCENSKDWQPDGTYDLWVSFRLRIREHSFRTFSGAQAYIALCVEQIRVGALRNEMGSFSRAYQPTCTRKELLNFFLAADVYLCRTIVNWCEQYDTFCPLPLFVPPKHGFLAAR